MSYLKTIILILFLTFSLLSCKDNREKRKEIVSEKIEQIVENQTEWNSLTQRILKDPFAISNQGKFTYLKDLDKTLAKELDNKGIKSITIGINSDCKQVEYTTKWTDYPIGTLYLTWTTCDAEQTKKGYYKDSFHDNFIEVWGIGNNWLIWTDSDFI
ncbi:hypothetical protein [uncultured Aquimarina sp.]|uniref:hypothetical protein n=1 Tax=uncultured Aquimarina sp. TaxID=575652 RepID=UPI0026379827|nr:hypothetical protein [uncultured Aquimarina sp.]